MLTKLKKKGFVSIVEIIITSVIFTLAAFGILSSITMIRPAGVDVSHRLDAAYIGKKFSEDLRNSIGSYTNGTRYSTSIPQGGITYTINWYVLDNAALGTRKLIMNVNY